MKPYVFLLAVTLFWLATSAFFATNVHANKKVGVSYTKHGSIEESNFMLPFNPNNGDTKAEEIGRILRIKTKKSKKKSNVPSRNPSKTPSMVPSQHPSKTPSMVPSQHPSKTPSMVPSQHPSKTPSMVPSQHPSKTPSMVPSQVQGCTANPNYYYCQLFGITDPNCQTTLGVGGPFWFNHDAEAAGAQFNFQNVTSEDAVCIKVGPDPAKGFKGFLQFWDDVGIPISALTQFSFDFLIKSCPGNPSAPDTNCKGNTFMTIYTRASPSNVVFYDCRLLWFDCC